jgi:hypothetical protein
MTHEFFWLPARLTKSILLTLYPLLWPFATIGVQPAGCTVEAGACCRARMITCNILLRLRPPQATHKFFFESLRRLGTDQNQKNREANKIGPAQTSTLGIVIDASIQSSHDSGRRKNEKSDDLPLIQSEISAPPERAISIPTTDN